MNKYTSVFQLKLKEKKFNFILFLFIILISATLRLCGVANTPSTLNPDEAALGYNAFSILKSGADEHGVKLPLSLQSFGDWKLPVYSYLDAISIFFLGISKLSVRLPSILAGIGMTVLIYFVAKEIFKNRTIALVASFFLAINPWSIFFSRGAYEVNVATTIFLAGFLSLLLFLRESNYYLLFLSFFLFGISMFTQHNYIVFVPIFILTVLFFQRKNFNLNKSFIFAAAFFIILMLISYISLFQGGGKKASNLNVFTSPYVLYSRAERLRGDGASPNLIIEKVLYNKVTAGSYQFALNYLSAFSPTVLFEKGGERLTHNIGDIGYLYVLDAFFFLLGITFLLWKREKSLLLLLLSWLFLAPLASAITTEHTGTRLFTLLPPVILISAYGAYMFIVNIRDRKLRISTGLGLLVLMGVSFIYFVNYYFVHFNTQRIGFWKYGYEDAVKISQAYKDFNVVMRGPENFPYIYFLLLNEYDPIRFRKEVVYYPITKEGFLYVKSFGRYQFVDKIEYTNLQKKTIYFDDINLNNNFEAITFPPGHVIMKYYINK